MSEPTPAPQTPSTSSPAPAPARPGRRATMLALVGLLVLLIGGVWLVVSRLPRWLNSGEGPEQAASTSASTSAGRKIRALLFYVTEDGAELQGVSQEVPYGATPAEQARHILEAQFQAPDGGHISAIPPNAKIRALYVGSKGDAYVDLAPEIRTAHGGGSLDEALTVFTIVNAITANLPGITAVQILIDGKEVDSLAGHIDLRHPLGRADGWIRKGQ